MSISSCSGSSSCCSSCSTNTSHKSTATNDSLCSDCKNDPSLRLLSIAKILSKKSQQLRAIVQESANIDDSLKNTINELITDILLLNDEISLN